MTLYLPENLRWLGWIAGTTWPDGDEDRMWDVARAWETASRDLAAVVGTMENAKRASMAAYTQGAGAEQVGVMFDKFLVGDQSIKALADLYTKLYEATFDMGTEIQAAKLNIIISLVWLLMEIIWAWVFPPTAPAAEAAAITTTRSVLRVLEDTVQGFIEKQVAKVGFATRTEIQMAKRGGDGLAAGTRTSRYWILDWKSKIKPVGWKYKVPSAKGISVYTIKITESIITAAAINASIQVGQMGQGKRRNFNGKEFGASIMGSAFATIPSREFGRVLGRGSDKFIFPKVDRHVPWSRNPGFGTALNNAPFRSGMFLHGAVIGAATGAVSNVFSNLGAATVTGDLTGLASPQGWTGSIARGAIVGGVRGISNKWTPPTGDQLRFNVWHNEKTTSFGVNRVRNLFGDGNATPTPNGADRDPQVRTRRADEDAQTQRDQNQRNDQRTREDDQTTQRDQQRAREDQETTQRDQQRAREDQETNQRDQQRTREDDETTQRDQQRAREDQETQQRNDQRAREDEAQQQRDQQRAREDQETNQRDQQRTREDDETTQRDQQRAREDQETQQRNDQRAREDEAQQQRDQQRAREDQETQQRNDQRAREDEAQQQRDQQRAREDQETQQRNERRAQEDEDLQQRRANQDELAKQHPRTEEETQQVNERRAHADEQTQQQRAREDEAQQQRNDQRVREDEAQQQRNDQRAREDEAQQQRDQQRVREDEAQQQRNDQRVREDEAQQQRNDQRAREDEAQQQRNDQRVREDEAQQQRNDQRVREDEAQQQRNDQRAREDEAQQQRNDQRVREDQAQQQRNDQRVREDQAQQQRNDQRVREDQAQQQRDQQRVREDQAQRDRDQRRAREDRAALQAQQDRVDQRARDDQAAIQRRQTEADNYANNITPAKESRLTSDSVWGHNAHGRFVEYSPSFAAGKDMKAKTRPKWYPLPFVFPGAYTAPTDLADQGDWRPPNSVIKPKTAPVPLPQKGAVDGAGAPTDGPDKPFELK
ncbi:hypothetical protein OG225_38630 [Nocardia sp. NBC_01377]|uniref:WXG100-like domain-containing protein n=1 Tax=Nocardia sp. NBC_01377 TaxID=2903595 RepID=UPI003247BB68